MYAPIILYGSEFWTLTKEDERKIEAAEMIFLRSVAGYTKLDKKRSEDIRTELNIFNLKDKIRYMNIGTTWEEHVGRMQDFCIPKIMIDYKPRDKRNIGKPQKR